MKQSRRSFLKTSGMLASGLAIGSIPFLKSCTAAEAEYAPFGLQLYTLRDVIGDDPEGIITQVAEAGYKQIESYEGRQGMFWGMGNTGFKQFMDDLGVEMISTHANVFQNYEQKVEDLAAIGVPNIVSPWIGPQETIDDFKSYAEQFNRMGEIARDAGLRFSYHNHAYTFEELEGQLPQDILMSETDPELVDFQMDIFWVVAAGHDPNEWFRKYPGRFTSTHVKDYQEFDGERESVILGNGTIDFANVLQVAEENGVTWNIVEQEQYRDTTPVDAIIANAAYMKELNA